MADDRAYLGMGDTLMVLDMSRMWPPVELGRTESFPERVYGVAASGDLAFAAAGPAGVRVVDVTVPQRPVEVGSALLPGEALGVAVRGAFAVVAAGSGGIVATRPGATEPVLANRLPVWCTTVVPKNTSTK